ncbi:MAG TPA: hypothetical protein VM783_10375 [Candidatus Acidoferrum sp.]|jgi:hypothetical protein|nr:hypothetical protein [Candidatus Acidoferrum sp.]
MAGGLRRPLGEAGKKAMKNKSRWHLLSGLQICYSLAGGKEVI